MRKFLICLLILFSITYAETTWKWGNCIYNNNASAYVTENDSIADNGSYTAKAYLFDSSSINPVCNRAETAYYKVNYLAGGGSGSMSQSTFEYGVASTLPACGFSRSGYTFTRWNNGAGTYYTNRGTISGGCNTSQNCAVNLVAEWSINNYSVGYNLNGGSASGLKTSYNVTESFTLPTPTRTGYTFTGWTGSNGSTPQTSVTVQKGTTGNLSYIANWQVQSFYFDVNHTLSGSGIGNSASSGIGSFDVYINGTLVANDVGDYYAQHPYGTTYQVTDIKARSGYTYSSASGSLSGTITSTTAVALNWSRAQMSVTLGQTVAPGNNTDVINSNSVAIDVTGYSKVQVDSYGGVSSAWTYIADSNWNCVGGQCGGVNCRGTPSSFTWDVNGRTGTYYVVGKATGECSGHWNDSWNYGANVTLIP